jgi:hypothetical protein
VAVSDFSTSIHRFVIDDSIQSLGYWLAQPTMPLGDSEMDAGAFWMGVLVGNLIRLALDRESGDAVV